jgi:hypothetical protein
MCLNVVCVHSFIWGHLAMCITTLYPIYEFFYPDAEDDEVAPQAAGTEAKVKFGDMAQGTPMEEVAGFTFPATAPGAQAYPCTWPAGFDAQASPSCHFPCSNHLLTVTLSCRSTLSKQDRPKY